VASSCGPPVAIALTRSDLPEDSHHSA
jgi:hypothetical protein